MALNTSYTYYYRNVSCRFFIDNDTKLHFLKKTQHFSFDERQLYPGSYPKRITTFEAIGGILGIIMIVFGYYMSTEMFGVFKALTTALITPFSILF